MVKNEIDTKNIRDLVDSGGFIDRHDYDRCDGRELSEKHIKKSKIYINSELTKRKSFNYDNSSYGIKHIASNFLEKEHRDYLDETHDDSYITNGEFIVAMVECGYRVKQIKNPGSGINALFDCSIIKRRKKKYNKY